MKKEFIVYIFAFVIAIGQPYPTKTDKDRDQMLAQQEAKNLEVLIGKGANATKESKCNQSQVMKQLQLINPDNKLIKPAVIAFVGKLTDNDKKMMDAADKITDMCNKGVQHEDVCEAAYIHSQCFMEAMKKVCEDTKF